MFALLQQINMIVLIQRDYIYEQLSNPARFISIPATPPYNTAKNTLQLPELAFLIDTNEGRAILYEFYLAQKTISKLSTNGTLARLLILSMFSQH